MQQFVAGYLLFSLTNPHLSQKAGFVIVGETVNALDGASKLMPLLRFLNKVPGLEDYTTVNMYVVARKT